MRFLLFFTVIFFIAACAPSLPVAASPTLPNTPTLTPIPTETPTPTATPLPTLPPELQASLEQRFGGKLAIEYINGQWVLTDKSGAVLGAVEPGKGWEDSKFSFTTTDDDSTVQNHEASLPAIIQHPSGVTLIDSGERVGFVWKGDI